MCFSFFFGLIKNLYQASDTFEKHEDKGTKAPAGQVEKQLRKHLRDRDRKVEQLRKHLQARDKTIAKLQSHLQLYDVDVANALPSVEVAEPPVDYVDDYESDYPTLLAGLKHLQVEVVYLSEGVKKSRETASAQRETARKAVSVLRQINADLLKREKHLAVRKTDEAYLLARKKYVDQAVIAAQQRISAATSVAAVVGAISTPAMLKTVLAVQICALHRLQSLATTHDFVAAANLAQTAKEHFGPR